MADKFQISIAFWEFIYSFILEIWHTVLNYRLAEFAAKECSDSLMTWADDFL